MAERASTKVLRPNIRNGGGGKTRENKSFFGCNNTVAKIKQKITKSEVGRCRQERLGQMAGFQASLLLS